MKGHIRQRGKNSFELKFDAGRDPATGERKIQYVSFRGTKREAQMKLAGLIDAVGRGSYIEPSKLTVANHVRSRIEQWQASGAIGALTATRYRTLFETQIVPHIGRILLQKLKPMDIERWHSTPQTSGRNDGKGGLSAQTIHHAHRVLCKALTDADRNDLVSKNVAKLQKAPKIDAEERAILSADQITLVVNALAGRDDLRPIVTTALYTGLRRGELMALRWVNVDLDNSTLKVVEALEELDGEIREIRVKQPKTKAGRRTVKLPDVVVTTLREHRKRQLELRLVLGIGKPGDDALVFPNVDGGLQSPSAMSNRWRRFAAGLGINNVTFHGLRHTHASMLIDRDVDIVTISKRLGHASPTITLSTYAHMFNSSDAKAADAINAALGGGKIG